MGAFTTFVIAAALSQAAPAEPRRTSVDELVRAALQGSGLVEEAEGKVDEWRGRLSEVQSIFYPKLSGMGFVAPMFRVRGAFPLEQDVTRDYTDWGPYVQLQALLVQPLTTFGRAAAGWNAAEHRMQVERARAQQTRNVLALEVRKFYYLHLYARSLLPALENGQKTLEKARVAAEELYESNSGKVTQVDLQKLAYGSAELEKYLLQAQVGAALSLEALKHMAAMPAEAPLVLVDDALPSPDGAPLPSLPAALRMASERRPEWLQVHHGKKAALSNEQAERLANLPTLFAAGRFEAAWTPMREDARNSYVFDPFNRVTGGVAVGLQFDVDPWKARAKGDAAHGLLRQVEGLEKFAATGIPLEVRKAYEEARQAEKLAEITERSSAAARKWMLFAGTAYSSGTGDASDVLEGVVSYLQSRRSYFEALQNVHTSRATLLYATGRTGLETP